MIQTWLHVKGDDYWEGESFVINLPALPRIGETVYLTEETMTELLARQVMFADLKTDQNIQFDDAFTVVDICYIEDEELPHIMISNSNQQ